ncbi:hypothetical protein INP51_01035 [Blautia liquoris]|uniref:Uncharacterized protein n=1 Tax=Blautia liquoris TaxID=2779518 RepID=A0A7M2RH83_9FIRM|nr:hypothetical protein [Blautia liquoris]QOV19599.1 hypothetical protein INP51_01035 [Blautia liquoris]
MSEQTIFLIFILLGTGTTLCLYILKAVKQVKYKGDERWWLIQLKATNAADIMNLVLILLLLLVPLFIDRQTTFTLQRIITFGLIYIGVRNLIELVAMLYFDKQL